VGLVFLVALAGLLPLTGEEAVPVDLPAAPAAGKGGAEEKAPAPAWPVFRGDAAMTGRCADMLAPPLELAWTIATKPKSPVVATAAIADGVAYIGDGDKFFHAIELSSGKALWKFEAGDRFEGSAAVLDDLVVVGCGDSFVYALRRKDGSLAWKFETNGEVLGSVNTATLPDGAKVALIGSYDNSLYCLESATGEKRWSFETANYINGAPAVVDGMALVGGCDGYLYKVDIASGELKGKIEVGSYIANTVALDGNAYTAHYGKRVEAYALAGDGPSPRLWQYGERDFDYFSSPALSPTLLVVGGRDRRLHCLKREDGTGVWEFRAGKAVDSSPVIAGNKWVYVGSDDGFLYAVDLATGDSPWSFEAGAAIKSSPAIAGGWLVIGDDGGNIHAFRAKPSP
jgi:outer membrane protein assembly factor BamB